MPQQDPSGPAKPGWTTTEFYQSLLLQVAAVVVAIVTILRPDFNLDSFQALVPVIAVALAAIGQIVYTISRTKVKVAAVNASAATETQLASPQITPALASTSKVDANMSGQNAVITVPTGAQMTSGTYTATTADVVPTALGVNGSALRNP